MSRTSKVTIYILAVLMIFAWITKDIYDISLLAYLDYSEDLTKEEQYLEDMGELTYGASVLEEPFSYEEKGVCRYDQISYMHKEKAPDYKYMGIIVQRDMALKRAVVLKSQVGAIIALAKSKNPDIYVGDIDE